MSIQRALNQLTTSALGGAAAIKKLAKKNDKKENKNLKGANNQKMITPVYDPSYLSEAASINAVNFTNDLIKQRAKTQPRVIAPKAEEGTK